MDHVQEGARQAAQRELDDLREFNGRGSKQNDSAKKRKRALSTADEVVQERIVKEAFVAAGHADPFGDDDSLGFGGGGRGGGVDGDALRRAAEARAAAADDADVFATRSRSHTAESETEGSAARVNRLLAYMKNEERLADQQMAAEGASMSRSASVVRDAGVAAAAGGGGGAADPDAIQFVPLRSVASSRLATTTQQNTSELNELFDSSCEEIEEAAREIMERRAQRGTKHRHSRSECGSSNAIRRHGHSVATESAGMQSSDDEDDDDDDGSPPPPRSHPSGKTEGGMGGRGLSSQMNCFLCRFGNREYDSIDKEDMKALVEALEKGIGHRNLFAHAKMIHKMYMSTIYASAQARGEQLPVWRTHQVLEHICSHEMDPRVFLYLSIVDFRTILEELKNRLFVRDAATGALVMHAKHYRDYRDTVKIICAMYKLRPEQMNFYTEGSAVNLAAANKRKEAVRFGKKVAYFGEMRGKK